MMANFDIPQTEEAAIENKEDVLVKEGISDSDQYTAMVFKFNPLIAG